MRIKNYIKKLENEKTHQRKNNFWHEKVEALSSGQENFTFFLLILLTFGEGWASLAGKPIWASTSRGAGRAAGERGGEVGRRNLSKMAMTRNMEMRMAVATKPKETALTELSKLVQCSSLWTLSGAWIGGHPLALAWSPTTIFGADEASLLFCYAVLTILFLLVRKREWSKKSVEEFSEVWQWRLFHCVQQCRESEGERKEEVKWTLKFGWTSLSPFLYISHIYDKNRTRNLFTIILHFFFFPKEAV